jgi:hypothetical protein
MTTHRMVIYYRDRLDVTNRAADELKLKNLTALDPCAKASDSGVCARQLCCACLAVHRWLAAFESLKIR